MAKGTKRNKERAAAQANKKRRVEKRNNSDTNSSSKPKSRPSGNQSGLTTAEIKAKRKLKGIGQFADDKGKDKDKDKDKDKGKGNKTKTQPNVVGGLTPKQRDQKIFQRVLGKDGELTRKIEAYQDSYGGVSKDSKKYLKELKESALQRMKIKPGKYDRSPKGTRFADLSMAEQYDKNSDRLMKDLEKPLTSYIDNPGDTKGLNMFDGNRELKFDSAKLRKFSSSPRIASTVRDKAEGLGVTYSGSNRVSKSLEGIGKVKNKKSSDLKSKFAQDLKFIV